MMTWRIAFVATFIPATLGASSLLVACNDDVDTPPWYPNYTDSGYGGAKPRGGAAGAAGVSSPAGSGGTTDVGPDGAGRGDAGEAGAT